MSLYPGIKYDQRVTGYLYLPERFIQISAIGHINSRYSMSRFVSDFRSEILSAVSNLISMRAYDRAWFDVANADKLIHARFLGVARK
jgi:hypothetical protein